MSSSEGPETRRSSVRQLKQQKAALARFGIEAFQSTDLDSLLETAAKLVSHGLDAGRAKVLEWLPEDGELLIRAGVGWDPDVVGKARIGADIHSPAGYALQSGQPVASHDLQNEERFRCPEVLVRHNIRSAVNVIVGGRNKPFGVLEVDSEQRRRFNGDDINFLQSCANLLASAIDRIERDRKLIEVAHQREVLLHELQHRVKNNLQMITSFISLQRRKSADKGSRQDLDIVAARVEALRVMYGKLYLVDHHGEVELGSYIEDLCHSLLTLQTSDGEAVELDIQCAPLRVHVDRSAPLGLFAGEFIMNSLKHAFPAGQGRLTVRLEEVDRSRGRLLLADDGPGLPENPGKLGGSGMRLMKQLAEQADATVTWRSGSGTCANLIFPI